MLTAAAVIIVVASYVVGIWAAVLVNQRIKLTRPAGMNLVSWNVFNFSIRTFVFLIVLLVVTTVLWPVSLLIGTLD